MFLLASGVHGLRFRILGLGSSDVSLVRRV